MTVIYYNLSTIEAKIYNEVAKSGIEGASRKSVCADLASSEIYGSYHDFEDASLAKFFEIAKGKYERNFKQLVKAKVLECVKRGPKPRYAVTGPSY